MGKPFEITADEQNVWINAATECLARLGRGLAQIFPTPYTSESLIPGDWDRWVKRVKEVHDIDVPPERRPGWAR